MESDTKRLIIKIGIFTVIAITGAMIFTDDLLYIWNVITSENMMKLEDLLSMAGSWAPLVSIFLMIFQSIIAPLPAFVIASTNGAVFGFFWGSILSWIGGMAGAIVSFYLARFFSEFIYKHYVKKDSIIDKVEQFSGENGFKIIVVARLLPFISFDFISYAAGLSKIKPISFLIATGIGMIPGTMFYTMGGYYISKFEKISRIITILMILFIIFTMIKPIINRRKTK